MRMHITTVAAQVTFLGAPPEAATVYGVLGQTVGWVGSYDAQFEGEEDKHAVGNLLGLPVKHAMFLGHHADPATHQDSAPLRHHRHRVERRRLQAHIKAPRQ